MITTKIETSVQWKRRIQNPKMELFRKKLDGLQALHIFTESSVSDASQGSKEASEW